MKLIVQIPCLNEERTLAATVRDIPRQIAGVDVVEILVIDDGSTDGTVEAAEQTGVDHILRFPRNRGLGHAFAAGLDRCLMLGADIIVNTDGDNQYSGADIARLVQPILDGKAEIVIGNRQTKKVAHFSWLKRQLEQLGSRVVSWLAGVAVPDVASGFRAYSREAAMRLVCSTDFDHTVDHVIQAGKKRIATASIPIDTNGKLRESRLFSHFGVFLLRSLGIIVRVYSSYRAMRIFTTVGLVTCTAGAMIGVRFLYIFFFDPATSEKHVQSLILAAILLLAGFQMFLTGIVADVINSTRSLLEDVSYRCRRLELGQRAHGRSEGAPPELHSPHQIEELGAQMSCEGDHGTRLEQIAER